MVSIRDIFTVVNKITFQGHFVPEENLNIRAAEKAKGGKVER